MTRLISCASRRIARTYSAGAFRVGRAQRQVRVAVDRGRGVAELVRGAGRDLAEVGQVTRQGDPALEAADLGQVGEERDGAEEPAVRPLGRRRRDAERRAPASPSRRQRTSRRPATVRVAQHLARRAPGNPAPRRASRSYGSPRLSRASFRISRPASLSSTTWPVRIDRQKPRRQVARQRARRRFEIVGALLLPAGEAFELALLLVQGLDRRLEPRDQEVAARRRAPRPAAGAPPAASSSRSYGFSSERR